MNPSRRHVQRQNARPTYTRRAMPVRGQRASRSRRQLPRPTWRPVMPLVKAAWLRLAAIAVVIIIVIVVLTQLTGLRHLRIQGNHTLTTAYVTQLTNAGLHHQLFGHNVLLMGTGGLASYLEHADLGIKQASITRQLPHTLTVTIQEREPTLNWKTGGVTYLLDANATVIGPTSGSYAQLPTVTDSSNLPVKAGDRVAPTQFVTFCVDLARLLPSTGYAIAGMTVPASTSEVYVVTTTGLTLKFDTTRPAADEISDLKAVQADIAAAKQTPTQYIDLRIAHKAYYK